MEKNFLSIKNSKNNSAMVIGYLFSKDSGKKPHTHKVLDNAFLVFDSNLYSSKQQKVIIKNTLKKQSEINYIYMAQDLILNQEGAF
ncbi:MAG TPA: hypothetical protein VMX17_01475, partial [Candidatus Glassbacteria bacterium]|nr:hypothetical protein [Candidatus Glassbacteria bacterium]